MIPGGNGMRYSRVGWNIWVDRLGGIGKIENGFTALPDICTKSSGVSPSCFLSFNYFRGCLHPSPGHQHPRRPASLFPSQ
jgi:hypothetical protein